MKKLVAFVLALVFALSAQVSAYAEPVEENELLGIVSAVVVPGDSPNAEETMWVTRTTDTGLVQKRLWSITYGVWLTDWITVGYVP